MHDYGSLRISTMWLFNLFLEERTIKQELQGKAVMHLFLILPLPSHLSVLLIILLLLLIILLLLLFLQEVCKALGPPNSPAGT